MKIKKTYIVSESSGTYEVDNDKITFRLDNLCEEYDFTPFGEGEYVKSTTDGIYDFILNGRRDENNELFLNILCFVPLEFEQKETTYMEAENGKYSMEN